MVSIRPFVLNRDVDTGLPAAEGTDGLLVSYTAVDEEGGEVTLSTSTWDILPATAQGLVAALDRMLDGDLVWSIEPNAGSGDLDDILGACEEIELAYVLRFRDDGDAIAFHDEGHGFLMDAIAYLRTTAVSRGVTPIERLILSARFRYQNLPTETRVNVDMKVGNGPEWTI